LTVPYGVAMLRGMETEDYWGPRSAQRLDGLRRRLKANRTILLAASWVLSTRRSDELWLSRVLTRVGARRVLDVACGGGKACLGPPFVTTGVDIDGAPIESAQRYGYANAVHYHPPEYRIDLPEPVDAVTAISLNAHIPFEAFQSILQSAIANLRPGGHVLLVAELDNEGLSYRLMRRFRPAGFRALVDGMAHYHLEEESAFVARMQAAFPALRLTDRQPLVASLVAFHQPFVSAFGRNMRTPLEHAIAFGYDVVAGLLNRAETTAFPARGRCFLVGYVFQKT
jgi:SAM-dependent methyltransferase